MNPNHELWKELYTAAILELDRAKMFARIRDAQMAICDRAEDLGCGGTVTERMALARALKALNELRDVYFGDSPTAEFQPSTLEALMMRRGVSKGEAA